jgi:hypothetical protein
MIVLNFDSTKPMPVTSVKRNWSSYTREKLCEQLALSDWSIEEDSVQGYWNSFENRLINIADTVAPLIKFKNDNLKKTPLPAKVRNQINNRKRLLKKQKTEKSIELKNSIKHLNKETRIRNVRNTLSQAAVNLYGEQ